jgi:pilus assembly protein CpaF
VVRLETRPPNIEGKGEVTQRALVRNALRMRPDRIILGEVRGAEAIDMLQAMNTGHEGSLATIHSNSPRDALARLENMVGMAGVNLTSRATRQQICSAVTVVMQVSRLTDGARKLVSLQEVTGMEGDVIAMHEIFRFEQTGVDANGRCSVLLRHRRAAALRRPPAPVRRAGAGQRVRSGPRLRVGA